jgi:hypothetical protein
MQSKHNYNGNFCTARKKLLDQANKALYALYRKIRNLPIPIDLQLKLFDSLITPILVYSCEVWGFEMKLSPHSSKIDLTYVIHLKCMGLL